MNINPDHISSNTLIVIVDSSGEERPFLVLAKSGSEMRGYFAAHVVHNPDMLLNNIPDMVLLKIPDDNFIKDIRPPTTGEKDLVIDSLHEGVEVSRGKNPNNHHFKKGSYIDMFPQSIK